MWFELFMYVMRMVDDAGDKERVCDVLPSEGRATDQLELPSKGFIVAPISYITYARLHLRVFECTCVFSRARACVCMFTAYAKPASSSFECIRA